MTATGDAVLTFAGRRGGVRATGLDGRRRWDALPDVRVREVVVAGPRAYALDEAARGTRVLDLATGAVLGVAPPLGDLDVLLGRPPPGASS